jgi:hypothetical protein
LINYKVYQGKNCKLKLRAKALLKRPWNLISPDHFLKKIYIIKIVLLQSNRYQVAIKSYMGLAAVWEGPRE